MWLDYVLVIACLFSEEVEGISLLTFTPPGDAKNLVKFVFPTSGISTFVSMNKAHTIWE